MKLVLTILSASILVGACSFAPKYEQPAMPVPAQFDRANDQTKTGADMSWEEIIKEPRLTALIKIALKNNRDLRIAIANVEAARETYGIQKAAILPTISASLSQSAQRKPNDLRTTTDPISRSYTAGVGLTSFELDLWGKQRNLAKEAFESYLATDEARKTTEMELIADVASSYFTWRNAQMQYDLAQRTITAYQGTYDLVKRQFDAGVSSALDLNQSLTSLQTAKSSLASAKRDVEVASHALDVLIGEPQPADLPKPLPFTDSVLIADIPAGLPSDLLTRRPDIMQAEHNLKAANANIGVARAAFFPSISLTALVGVMSPQLGGLFGAYNDSWSFSPSVSVPIFTAGSLSHSLNLAEIQKNIDIATYEKTIQVAFQDVADALTGEATYKEQMDALRTQAQAAEKSLELAELRYKNGIDSFLQVQEAQITYFQTEQTLLNTGLAQLQNRLALYKALGGGWSVNPDLRDQALRHVNKETK